MLKKALIGKYNFIDECKLCKCGNEWNGGRLSLQLDHINGNNTDNRVENLRILCPNCHSQTETYGGKSKKIKKTMLTVDKEFLIELSKNKTLCEISKILKVSIQTVKKALKHYDVRYVQKKPDISVVRKFDCKKEDLEKLIYDNPLTKVGIMFGVSDNAIRKRCKFFDIEIPQHRKRSRQNS